MKRRIINFWEGKGMFCVYLLIIILIGETGDWLNGDLKFSVSRYAIFFKWYFAIIVLWFIVSTIRDYIKERQLRNKSE